MKAKDYIRFCRYYKGEPKCPFNDGDAAAFWDYEKVWAELNSDEMNGREYLADMIDVYGSAGLALFEIHDDTPVSLKALLFNRYCKWNSASIYECADGFKTFYKDRYYSK